MVTSLCLTLGFIEFIVEPSLTVCSDMLEVVLGPFQSANQANQKLEEKPSDSPKHSNTGKKAKIHRPWVACLAENKRIWKEQAAKGMLYQFLIIIISN